MTGHDFRTFSVFGAIFIAVGVAYALIKGDSLIFGALAGICMVAFLLGVAFLVTWIGGKQ